VPNFGHWRVRAALLTTGRMPETRALPEPWWSTPNIHLCTLRDFTTLCEELDLRIDACAALSGGKAARPIDPSRGWENWRSESALFLLSRRAQGAPEAVPQNLFGEVELPKADPPCPKRRAKARA
jgi:methionine biosynthesis protein MetW